MIKKYDKSDQLELCDCGREYKDENSGLCEFCEIEAIEKDNKKSGVCPASLGSALGNTPIFSKARLANGATGGCFVYSVCCMITYASYSIFKNFAYPFLCVCVCVFYCKDF